MLNNKNKTIRKMDGVNHEELNFSDVVRFYITGIQKSQLGDLQGAKLYYDKALKINPNLAEVYYARAYLKYCMKDYEGAFLDYSKVFEINPNFEKGYHNEKPKGDK